LGLLRQADANLAVTMDDLKSGGLDYRSIVIHVVLQGGKLRVAPFDATLPEGKLAATLSVDADAAAPPVALTMHAPGLAVAPLLSAAGMPGYASGKLEVYADLHGAGASPHAIAAGLDGTIGLAMQNGTIDTKLLNKLLGPVLDRANLLGLLSGGGSSELRCFALRADAQHGIADLRTLLLDSSVLTMDGTGSVNLGDETLALRLRPQGRIAGTALVVPLQVSGPIRTPAVKVNALGAAKADVGSVAGAVVGTATPLGLIGGMLGGGKLLNTAPVVSCPDALAMARGQTPAAAPAPTAQAKKPRGPQTLLKDLFR
jgi:AsmA protein